MRERKSRVWVWERKRKIRTERIKCQVQSCGAQALPPPPDSCSVHYYVSKKTATHTQTQVQSHRLMPLSQRGMRLVSSETDRFCVCVRERYGSVSPELSSSRPKSLPWQQGLQPIMVLIITSRDKSHWVWCLHSSDSWAVFCFLKGCEPVARSAWTPFKVSECNCNESCVKVPLNFYAHPALVFLRVQWKSNYTKL